MIIDGRVAGSFTRKRSCLVVVMVIGVLSPWYPMPLARGLSFYGFDDASHTQAEAWGISPDGSVVVGDWRIPFLSGTIRKAAYRQGSGPVMAMVNGGLADVSVAEDASTAGSVVVGRMSSSYLAYGEWQTTTVAFRWTSQDGAVSLGTLPGQPHSWAWGVSNDGSVVVGSSGSTAPYGSPYGSKTVDHSAGQAFRWTSAGGMVGLGCLPGDTYSQGCGVSGDGSVVVGYSYRGPAVWLPGLGGTQAFRWTEAGGMVGLGYLPGGTSSRAFGVSADGGTVVGTGTSNGVPGTEAFRWTEASGMVSLGAGYGSYAIACSGDGSIIVGYILSQEESSSYSTAFIWDSAHGSRDLKTVLTTDYGLDLSGWTLGEATGISDDGRTIVGVRTDPLGNPVGWVAVIPEPGTLMLLVVSLAGLRRWPSSL